MMTYGGIAWADWNGDVRKYPLVSQDGTPSWKPMSYAVNARTLDTQILMQLADREYLGGLKAFTALREQKNPVDLFVCFQTSITSSGNHSTGLRCTSAASTDLASGWGPAKIRMRPRPRIVNAGRQCGMNDPSERLRRQSRRSIACWPKQDSRFDIETKFGGPIILTASDSDRIFKSGSSFRFRHGDRLVRRATRSANVRLVRLILRSWSGARSRLLRRPAAFGGGWPVRQDRQMADGAAYSAVLVRVTALSVDTPVGAISHNCVRWLRRPCRDGQPLDATRVLLNQPSTDIGSS